ncbi:MAG: hypothetical protein EZS28_034305 [Streblomastix strix]|uniref:SPRY domain-containing protein n=1 Tax=Streblomastix strix TaxID=222440 RepID=A0A5J4UHY9_9EUKA|nr:MAG: hypothetical protein EZS28_034305 [Streblomastix strix]
MLESMISKIPSQRPSVQSLLESNIMQLVSVIEKSNEEKETHESKEQMNKRVNELELKVQLLEFEKEKEKQEKINALSEIDKLKQEKIKALSEKDKTIAEKEQEKQKTQSERDQEKRRADTEHAEVISLTAEITKLNQSLQSDPDHVIQQENKIIRTNKGLRSTVAFNPAITSGIVRLGGFFKDDPFDYFRIGIADSSAVFGSDEGPNKGENDKKTVCCYKDGDLEHFGDYIRGNSPIELNKSVAMEVNMNIRPHTLTFFCDNQEQPVSVINIPSSIRFILSPQETLASPLYFEIAKWAAGTGCSVEMPIPMGRPCIKILKKAIKVTA